MQPTVEWQAFWGVPSCHFKEKVQKNRTNNDPRSQGTNVRTSGKGNVCLKIYEDYYDWKVDLSAGEANIDMNEH